jgi:poly-gamma-glutamate synthase PgsB/CapB
MILLTIVFFVGAAIMLVLGIVEQRRHFRNLDAVPARILVNGIRGKSSITRLTAGALRGGGLRVVGKTTGSAARYIYPDGSEIPVYRPFDVANVAEQISVVRQAVLERPDALVLECMAVDPSLQQINQEKLARSTIGIVSNVRADHLTEMGPTLEDVARSLCRSMPRRGICITSEAVWWSVLQQEAERRQCKLLYANAASVTDEEMAAFTYFTFKENVAIALEVARLLGISRDDALRGMWASDPDPGVLSVASYEVGGKHLRFANVFAANDPNSTLLNVHTLVERRAIQPPIYTLINCRPDRIERNAQMGKLVPELRSEKLFVVGHPTRSASRAVPRGWDGELIELGGDDRHPREIVSRVLDEIDVEASLVAVGNIHGQGEQLLDYLETLGGFR